MEYARWIDWHKTYDMSATSCDRIYFGHETCQYLLPPPEKACEIVAKIKDQGLNVTLVVPFLTNEGMSNAKRLIDCMFAVLGMFEVVSADWGMIHYLSRHNICYPIISRLLVAQSTDPRIGRMFNSQNRNSREILHLDGTRCLLKYRPPSPQLFHLNRSTWIGKPDVIRFLMELGVRGCEISNTVQGVELEAVPNWSYSLHLPYVPISVMRRCPGKNENFSKFDNCCPKACGQTEARWLLPGFPVSIIRRTNALFYKCSELPKDLYSLPIDRIVMSERHIVKPEGS